MHCEPDSEGPLTFAWPAPGRDAGGIFRFANAINALAGSTTLMIRIPVRTDWIYLDQGLPDQVDRLY